MMKFKMGLFKFLCNLLVFLSSGPYSRSPLFCVGAEMLMARNNSSTDFCRGQTGQQKKATFSGGCGDINIMPKGSQARVPMPSFLIMIDVKKYRDWIFQHKNCQDSTNFGCGLIRFPLGPFSFLNGLGIFSSFKVDQFGNRKRRTFFADF